MEILFLSTWFPFPMDNGARIRVNHLLRALGERHQVHLVSYLPFEKEKEYLSLAKTLCASVSVINRDPFWRNSLKGLLGYFSLLPRDVVSSSNPEMTRLVRDLAQKIKFDLIIASTVEVAPYSLKITNIPRILEEHNFMTAWMEQRFRKQSNLIKQMKHWVTWQKCFHYERRLFTHFKAVTMVSEHDQQAVKAAFPKYKGRVEVIPNGVDLETHHFRTITPQPDTMIFNGSLTYAANLGAIRFFIKEVFPLIIQQNPGVHLKITGRTENVDLSWLQPDPNIEFTGYLEDVCPAVASSWICIAPLLDGSGTRIKILEAMALGTPVVATSKGAEGLNVIHGEHLLIADTPENFSKACLKLLEDSELRQSIAEKARNLVEKQYSWKQIGVKFNNLIEQIMRENQQDFQILYENIPKT